MLKRFSNTGVRYSILFSISPYKTTNNNPLHPLRWSERVGYYVTHELFIDNILDKSFSIVGKFCGQYLVHKIQNVHVFVAVQIKKGLLL
jgi:hypothetical protein